MDIVSLSPRLVSRLSLRWTVHCQHIVQLLRVKLMLRIFKFGVLPFVLFIAKM